MEVLRSLIRITILIPLINSESHAGPWDILTLFNDKIALRNMRPEDDPYGDSCLGIYDSSRDIFLDQTDSKSLSLTCCCEL